jgi:peptidoglycan/xylan/chitin deacetylase (PgdA/CDA1 family)
MLEYHFIRDPDPANPVGSLGWNLSTTPANFAEEMALLAYDHVHVMTLYEFAYDLHNSLQPTCPSVVLTFDDGYASVATVVAPILYSYDFPGASFVISGLIGHDAYMTAQQIQWVASLGINIGDHTVTHPNLTSLSAAASEAEIVDAQKTLEPLAGMGVVDFCYPSGRYDAQVVAQLQAAGFRDAFAETNGAAETWANRFWLSRYEVLGSWTVAGWARTIGIAPPPAGWTPPPPPYGPPPPAP